MIQDRSHQKKGFRRLMIRDGLFVDQLSTVEACDRALMALGAQIQKIQRQLEKPAPWSDHDWAHKAITALAYRKATRIAVHHRREELRKAPAELRVQQVYAQLAKEFMKRHPNECRLLTRQIAGKVR